jgi:hypothetical protein
MTMSPSAVDDLIYETASTLTDQGYGSFDRCLQVYKACKGDLTETKRVLSKLIFKEFKKQWWSLIITILCD